MSKLYGLKNKIDDLESVNNVENKEDVRVIKKRINILKEITSALVEEIEKLDFIRPIRIRQGLSLRDEVQGFEVHLIQSALKQTGGHQTHAARLLGVSITTLNAKIKRLGITPNLDFDSSVLYEKNGLSNSVEHI
jgi:transcriptional regulator with GAF, ATPase, and Fis domain